MMGMNYEEARKYIENTGSCGIIPGTAVIRELLAHLGNPERALRVIHVAGTNGKGSVCSYLESIFLECGLKTGRYSSPSVFEYLERIRFCGENISEPDYAEAVSEVRKASDLMENKPTSFEAETAAAFLYFANKKADVIIVECGMGGLEDATNVFESHLASVFTPISMDHMGFLGDDPESIAKNKAGIMREGCPAVISDMPPVVHDGKETDVAGVLMECVGKAGAIPVPASGFSVPDDIKNPLSGSFQKINLQTALAAVYAVREKLSESFASKKITDDIIYRGVAKTRHPGRYEKISDTPVIIRDGAHNPGAAMALRDALRDDESLPVSREIHLIMGVFKDKDYEEILRIMLPGAVSFTAVDLPDKKRGLPADVLAEAARKIAAEEGAPSSMPSVIKTAAGIKEALESASGYSKIPKPGFSTDESPDPSQIFVVFGSLSMMQLF